jgi:uncharacterized RDD family membrane protein YckC
MMVAAMALRIPFIGRRRKRDERKTDRWIRLLRLPEGIVLPVEIASYGERVSAALLDFVLLHLLFFGGAYLIYELPLGLDHWHQFILLLLLYFLLRVGFFMVMELVFQGRTPGKMLIGLRVIDRRGGPLRRHSIIARNLTREVEMYIPLVLGLIGLNDSSSELAMISLGWLALLVFFPLFNRDRMRLGDLIGGTWVIHEPKLAKETDLVDVVTSAGLRRAPRHHFTTAQLEHYGIYELQTLERVLRADSPDTRELRQKVADTIAQRIGFGHRKIGNPDVFLQDFYIAQRDRLETMLRHGQRRERKHSASS